MHLTYILLAYSALFILGFIDNSRGPVYPELLNYFQLSKTSGSMIFSIASLSGFIISLVNKYWLRIGVLNSTRLTLVFDSLACLLMGTASQTTNGYYQFLFASVLLGLSMGMKGILLNVIIQNKSKVSHRRRVFAGLHAMYGIASLLAPFIIAKLLSLEVEWKSYFFALAILPIMVLAATARMSESITMIILPTDKVTTQKAGKLLGLMFALYVSSEILISSRLVIYLNESKNYSLAEASIFLSSFFLALLLGRILFAVREFKRSSFSLLNLSLMSSFLISLLALIFDARLLALNGVTMSFFFPTAMDWLGQNFKDSSDAIIAKVMIAVGAGLVLMHFGFGLLADLLGVGASMWILPIMLMISWYLLHFCQKKWHLSL